MADHYEKESLRAYPRLTVDLGKLRENISQIVKICAASGIEVAGVVKGFNGLAPALRPFAEAGCRQIASSRLEHLRTAEEAGLRAGTGAGDAGVETLLVRIPMLSEVPAVIRYADISLESEPAVLEALEKEAAAQGVTHGVILMADLGDLREGFWDKDEMVEAAVHVEQQLPHIELLGVGVNLGCYGAICPDTEKMNDLIHIAERIEEKIGRQLRYISGGATTSFPLVLSGEMPARINHLRIGEGILINYDLPNLWGLDMTPLHADIFTLEAEVIEVKNKPTHPVGRIFVDCFGDTPVYEDRGIRRRALLGMGKLDYTMIDKLYPHTEGVALIGDSSDHAILDVEDCKEDIRVGDVLDFNLAYPAVLYLSQDPYITIQYRDEE